MGLFDDYAREYWDRTKPFLERLEEWYGLEPVPPVKHYRIYDEIGLAIACPICAETDRWAPEGEVDGQPRVWVCEHERGLLLPCRNIASIRHDKVTRVEES